MALAFIFANISIWNFINTLSSQASYGDGVVIPIIQVNALQVTGYIDAWTKEGLAIPTMAPGVIPNYPFIIFWVAVVGNLVLMAFILRRK